MTVSISTLHRVSEPRTLQEYSFQTRLGMSILHGLFEGIFRRRRCLNHCPTHGAVDWYVKVKSRREKKKRENTARLDGDAPLCTTM